MLIDHHDQQIVWRKTQNLKLCFETNVGTNQAQIEKILISRAILLAFLRSLVSAIRRGTACFVGYDKLQDNSDIQSHLKCFRWEWKFLISVSQSVSQSH